MNKQELIEAYLAEPIKVGDKASILGLGTQNKKSWGYQGIVTEVLPGNRIKYDHERSTDQIAEEGEWKKYVGEVGFDPFPAKRWDAAIRFAAYQLSNVLSVCGFDWRTNDEATESSETVLGQVIPELCWNPVLTNSDGVEVVYQRDFCWTLNDKQLLIDSIYNGIEIGKIVIRNRSWAYVEARVKAGKIEHTAFRDIVDGKQRLRCLMDFVQGKFTDSDGRYFRDMSRVAQRKFMTSSAISFGEIGEGATDEDVKTVFVNINFAGVPMSQDHIDFVKGINLK
jgi:hypothetical protein